MDANQLPARGRDIRLWTRCQPAHELEDRRLDLTPEEQPAVAGQRASDGVGQLADGDEVAVTIESIGTLTNKVVIRD